VRLFLALVVLLAFPAAAAGLPGDPPIVLLAPADGATVAADPDGIPVQITCPAYRKFQSGSFTAYGDYTDYEVIFATRPDLGADGRLLDANVIDRDIPLKSNAGPDQCSSGMDASSAVPGTYYWQAAWLCTGCPSGHETSAVRSFAVRTTLRLALAVPKRAFGGYPIVAPLRAAGVPTAGR
jgi:hypothetical protein